MKIKFEFDIPDQDNYCGKCKLHIYDENIEYCVQFGDLHYKSKKHIIYGFEVMLYDALKHPDCLKLINKEKNETKKNG